MSELAREWVPVDIRLSYRLGEIGLFHKRLTGYADRTHFSRRAPIHGVPEVDDNVATSFFYYPTYPVAEAPPPVVVRDRWIAYTPYTFKNYYIDIARFQDFDHYLRTVFSSKSRATLLRKARKFAQAEGGEVCCRRFERSEEMVRFFADAGQVSARSYQERLLDAGLPRDGSFIAHTAAMAAAGRVLGFVLYLHDKPVAYMLCGVYDGVATYEHVGYDPAVQALSPGTVLHYLALESIFAEGRVRLFDFTEGEGQHKAYFASDFQRCAKTYFLRRSLFNLLLVRSHYRLNRSVEAVGRALDRLGIKTALKRFIRRVS